MAADPLNAVKPSTSSALASAVTRVLRPLVGLLVEHGLTYQWLNGLLKSLFVDVAEKDFRLPGKRQTDSRITLLSGVHRKDVRRLRQDLKTGEPAPPANVYLGAHLVAIWTSESGFLDDNGKPRPLPRLAGGDGPSFEELVTSVSKDIRPRVVLDEWLRLGAVEVDDDDRVRLRTEAFVPSKGFEEKAYYLGRNVHDHIAATCHNVRGEEPSMLERSVYYDDLSSESVRELEALARQQGSAVLQALNRRARELQARDLQSGGGHHRMNFGLYFFHETEDTPHDDQA